MDSAASLGHVLLRTLASKAWAISSAGRGLIAISSHKASGGPSSCWRSAGKCLEEFSDTAWGREEGLFQRGDMNKCSAPTSLSPKRTGSKLQALSIHLFSITTDGTASCSADVTMHESISAQGICTLLNPCYIFHAAQLLSATLAPSADEFSLSGVEMEPWGTGLKSSACSIHPIYTQMGWSHPACSCVSTIISSAQINPTARWWVKQTNSKKSFSHTFLAVQINQRNGQRNSSSSSWSKEFIKFIKKYFFSKLILTSFDMFSSQLTLLKGGNSLVLTIYWRHGICIFSSNLSHQEDRLGDTAWISWPYPCH